MASTDGSTRRDGLAWHRPFRQEFFLRRNADDSFDSGSLFTNSTPVMHDDEMRFYYGAYSQGATSANDYTHASGIGLAVLPRDRIAGIAPADSSDQTTLGDAVEGVGQVTLRPVDLSSCAAVVVNADATAGSVRVEILDAQGRRLRGFARDDALPLEDDALDHVARWREKTVADLPEGPHLLRLHLTEAVVYAVSLPAITEA